MPAPGLNHDKGTLLRPRANPREPVDQCRVEQADVHVVRDQRRAQGVEPARLADGDQYRRAHESGFRPSTRSTLRSVDGTATASAVISSSYSPNSADAFHVDVPQMTYGDSAYPIFNSPLIMS